MGKKWLSVGVLGILLLPGASAVHARELAKHSFGGKGWNQSDLAASIPLPVSFAGVSRGSISFDLQRTGDAPRRGRPSSPFWTAPASRCCGCR